MTIREFSALVQKYQGLVYTVCHQLVPDGEEAQEEDPGKRTEKKKTSDDEEVEEI